MGPKKRENFRNKSEKCHYYNTGYCKNGESCQDYHADKVCPDTNCFEDKCPFRHPNPCKFGQRCIFNKKKICCFSHVTLVSDDRFADLEKRIKIVEKEKQACKDLAKKMENKCEVFENKIEMLNKAVSDKEQQVTTLSQRLNTLENTFETRVKELEICFKANSEKFKCQKCDFSTNSENGLKTHVTKKHKEQKQNIKETFPKQCSLCDLIFKSKKEMSKHVRTHSYSYVQFKCEHCEFIGGEEIDMEVHSAKLHGDKFECGVCDYEATDLENLEIHLKTCEYYKCELCDEIIWQFTDIKGHVLAKHKSMYSYQSNGIRNIKPSRENKELYDQKFHTFISLFPELEGELKIIT